MGGEKGVCIGPEPVSVPKPQWEGTEGIMCPSRGSYSFEAKGAAPLLEEVVPVHI